ncbi:uncharacterized protein LOC141622497 [Silene latifolia]|uniref:uncharacterized protein LOC141622497 n=1 Tax=Silene latifolia TaxID=37657 RepID=UPI003D77BC24
MPIKIKNMKTIDLSCASQTSTAICSSTKSFKTLISNTYSPSKPPCNSDELPFNPRLSSFSSSYREKTRKLTSIVNHADIVPRRRSSADVMDIKRYIDKHKSSNNEHSTTTTTYLLGESKRNDIFSTPVFGSEGRRSTSRIETRPCFGSVRDGEKEKIRKHFSLIDFGDEKKINKQRNNAGETCCNGVTQKQLSMGHSGNHSSVQKHPPDQVVVLRVSLHCKGCEGKLRKHLSKIEGVTSFSIDMETKKVTVTGNVTPLALLTSISKVKNAQFWPTETTNSSASSSSSSTSSTTVDFS